MKAGKTAKLLIGPWSLALLLTFSATSMALEEVKLHISGSGSPFPLIFRVGRDKGFYKEEGLEVLPIAANLLTGIQGLTAGSFDFSQILGQGSAAILRGFPLKIIMVFDTRPHNQRGCSQGYGADADVLVCFCLILFIQPDTAVWSEYDGAA